VASVVSIGAVSGPLAVADPGLVFQIAAATAVIWLLMLSAFATRDVKLIGSGAAEYTRMIHATGFAFGLLAMIDVAIDVDGIRAQLFVALPLGIGVLLFERWLWRRWLIRRRLAGAYTTRAIVVGERADVEYVIRSIADPGLGYQVVGASLRGTTSTACASATPSTRRCARTAWPKQPQHSTPTRSSSPAAETKAPTRSSTSPGSWRTRPQNW
jgi:hypothetical protein